MPRLLDCYWSFGSLFLNAIVTIDFFWFCKFGIIDGFRTSTDELMLDWGFWLLLGGCLLIVKLGKFKFCFSWIGLMLSEIFACSKGFSEFLLIKFNGIETYEIPAKEEELWVWLSGWWNTFFGSRVTVLFLLMSMLLRPLPGKCADLFYFKSMPLGVLSPNEKECTLDKFYFGTSF